MGFDDPRFGERGLDSFAVFDDWLHVTDDAGRLPLGVSPLAKFLANRPERVELAPSGSVLDELDDVAIVPLVSERIVLPVPVGGLSDGDLVAVCVPHHAAVSAALALVAGIAPGRGERHEVDVVAKSLEFIPVVRR